jgi:DNA-directed RNA polymerase specialized sigma24 family protein
LLEALSGEQRMAFALCWLGEHTYREAAELLSWPDRDVLHALRLGLQALEMSGNSGQMGGRRPGQTPTPGGPSV